MKKVFLIIFITIQSIGLQAAGLTSFYEKSDQFFKKYVRNGRINYKGIKANGSEIDYLYKEINAMNLEGAGDDEKKAFYINAYNLIVIYQVTKYYPLKSPLDKSGFFDKVKHVVGGEAMTLNYLEIKKLLIPYKDARFHFVLACAAISCPPLASFAYKPGTLDEMLTLRTKKAINDKDWLRVNPQTKTLALSKIFEWYQKDFTMEGKNSVIAFVNTYREQKIPAHYKISYYEYNWSLNEE